MKFKRHKISKNGSKKLFTKTAMKVHHRNAHSNPMRGGIRF